MRQVIRADGIPFLVAMATSEHLVMQNEALVSLTLITATVLGKILVFGVDFPVLGCNAV